MAALAVGLAVATSTSATSYQTNITAGPSDFSCATANDVRTCSEFILLGTPVTMNAGDTYTIDVSLTYRAVVPGSKTLDLIYGQLWDYNVATQQVGVAAGTALVTTTAQGYIGPPPAFTSYAWPTYTAALGFCCGYPGLPNNGFSFTGAQNVILAFVGDPNPIIGIDIGSQVGIPEPAAWVLLTAGFGLVGASLRGARRRAARLAAV
jgi:hypothetical protein